MAMLSPTSSWKYGTLFFIAQFLALKKESKAYILILFTPTGRDKEMEERIKNGLIIQRNSKYYT